MSKEKSKEELIHHKEKALKKMETYLDSLITSDDSKKKGKSDKLSYWLEDWTTFLDFEEQFSPMSLRRYKRGEIIKIHLGFNIGSEEGGLHYAVVLDKNNAKSSPVVTIVPLTSVKPHTDISHLKNGSIFLGNELFTSLNAKVSSTSKKLTDELKRMKDTVDKMSSDTPLADSNALHDQIVSVYEEIAFINRMHSEIQKMKMGSIALVNQITTISKIRIYDPKTNRDILSGIKLSNEKLDLIDQEIRQRFTNF